MKKQITWGELLGVLVVVIGSILTAWVNIHTTQAVQETRITQLEQNYRGIQEQLNEIKQQNTAILVKLEDKEDRSKNQQK